MSSEEAPRPFYWDACCFLSLIENEPGRGPILAALMEACQNGELDILTSFLTVTEVAFAKAEKDQRALDQAVEERIDALWFPPSRVRLEDVHQVVTFDARQLLRKSMIEKRKLKPVDAIHLATALRRGAKEFHTYDAEVLALNGFVPCRICEPRLSDRLPLA